jgi:hypothetical protein
MVFLMIAALFVASAPWRWAPVVAALFGAVFTAGFFATPAGLANLFGGGGAEVAVAQGAQLLGELTALVAGVAAAWAGHARPAGVQRRGA